MPYLIHDCSSHPTPEPPLLADFTMDVAGSRIEAGQVRDEVAERTQKRFQVTLRIF